MLSEEKIKSIFEQQGFNSKFLQRYQVHDGIEDPVTGKKSAWTVSWQLDKSPCCEYVEVNSEAELVEALLDDKHQQALSKARAAYLEVKCMEVNKFDQACVTAISETKPIQDAIKKLGNVKDLWVQPDFYEPSMHCIAEGSEKINDEEAYDERCVAGSMDADVANKMVHALKESRVAISHIQALTKGGRELVKQHIDLISENETLQEKCNEINVKFDSAQNEIESLKSRLDSAFSSAMLSGEGEGNVTVANPEKFAKVVRVLDGLYDKIDRAQKGEEVSGFSLSGGGLTKEMLYFKSMIEMILESVKG